MSTLRYIILSKCPTYFWAIEGRLLPTDNGCHFSFQSTRWYQDVCETTRVLGASRNCWAARLSENGKNPRLVMSTFSWIYDFVQVIFLVDITFLHFILYIMLSATGLFLFYTVFNSGTLVLVVIQLKSRVNLLKFS